MVRLAAMTTAVLCVLASGCGDATPAAVSDAGDETFDAISDGAMDGGATPDARADVRDAPAVRDAPDVPFDDGVQPYTEAICNDASNLDDLAAAWTDTPVGLRDAVHGIVARRYPMAAAVLTTQDDAQLALWFTPARSFRDVLGAFATGVREAGRARDAAMSGSVMVFRLRDDLVLPLRPVEGFARREILTLHAAPGIDPYVDSYLLGPAGAEGFESVLEDLVQDTHALAAKFCTRDAIAPGAHVAARDAVLTMMYYVELYLMRARTSHPGVYAAVIADPAYRRLLKLAWQRAEFWLDATDGHPELAVRDREIEVWTYAPANLLEMVRLPE
ncbi:MAG: hypothetical protein U0326_35295 [Polyangiales bacterium]